MIWLHGAAGAGKTSLGQTIAEISKKEGRHLGSVFMSRTTAAPERSDGNRVIPTLVYQLLQAFPEIKALVEKVITDDPGIFSKSSKAQMDGLFIGPLMSYVKSIMTCAPTIRCLPRLIIVDALDECQDPSVQRDLLRTFAEAASRIPLPFRILITSRPEANITRLFNDERVFQSSTLVQRIDLGRDTDADGDIERFLKAEFAEIRRSHPLATQLKPSWPTKHDINTLVERASTQFIYASTVINYVRSPSHPPVDRLKVILGLCARPTRDAPFAQLDALYSLVFHSIPKTNRESIKRVFAIMFIASKKSEFEMGGFDSLKSLEQVLNMQPGDLTLVMEPLLSLVALPLSRYEGIKTLHASLFDFLLDPTRSGSEALEVGLGHETLALHYLNTLPKPTQGKLTLCEDCLRLTNDVNS